MCHILMLTGVRLFCAAGLLALTASPVLAQAARQSSGEPRYYSEDYPGPTPSVTPQRRPARIRVRLPADAELLVNDKPTTSTGPVREFETSELDPDQVYNYLLLARWTEGGINVEKRFRVRALSGNRVTVNFVPIAQERPRRAVSSAVRIVGSSATALSAPLPPLAAPPTDWRAPRSLPFPRGQ